MGRLGWGVGVLCAVPGRRRFIASLRALALDPVGARAPEFAGFALLASSGGP